MCTLHTLDINQNAKKPLLTPSIKSMLDDIYQHTPCEFYRNFEFCHKCDNFHFCYRLTANIVYAG